MQFRQFTRETNSILINTGIFQYHFLKCKYPLILWFFFEKIALQITSDYTSIYNQSNQNRILLEMTTATDYFPFHNHIRERFKVSITYLLCIPQFVDKIICISTIEKVVVCPGPGRPFTKVKDNSLCVSVVQSKSCKYAEIIFSLSLFQDQILLLSWRILIGQYSNPRECFIFQLLKTLHTCFFFAWHEFNY